MDFEIRSLMDAAKALEQHTAERQANVAGAATVPYTPRTDVPAGFRRVIDIGNMALREVWQQLRAIEDSVQFIFPNAGAFGPTAVSYDDTESIVHGCKEKATAINVFLNREACLIAEKLSSAKEPLAKEPPRFDNRPAGARWP